MKLTACAKRRHHGCSYLGYLGPDVYPNNILGFSNLIWPLIESKPWMGWYCISWPRIQVRINPNRHCILLTCMPHGCSYQERVYICWSPAPVIGHLSITLCLLALSDNSVSLLSAHFILRMKFTKGQLWLLFHFACTPSLGVCPVRYPSLTTVAWL